MSHECTRDQYLLNFSADVTFRRLWCPRMTNCAIMSPPYLLHVIFSPFLFYEEAFCYFQEAKLFQS